MFNIIDNSSQEFYVWFLYHNEMNRSQWLFRMLDIFKNNVLTGKLVNQHRGWSYTICVYGSDIIFKWPESATQTVILFENQANMQ